MVEIWLWLVLAAGGMFFAAYITRAAWRNWLYQRVEPRSIRHRIARAHLRRALIKLVCQTLFMVAGVIAVLAPSPVRTQVQVQQAEIAIILILVAMLLDVDLYFDFRLQRIFEPLSNT